MNFVEALVEMFLDEKIAISADDKHKVNVGTLAVSWHITKYDQANQPDPIFLMPMFNLFLLDIYYSNHEIGDQGR